MKLKLPLLLCALLCAISANAQYLYDFNYDYNGTTLYFKKTSNNTVGLTYGPYTRYSGDITIPSSVVYQDNNYIVNSICDQAFQYCRDVTSIDIPNTVTSIGEYAFSSCIYEA